MLFLFGFEVIIIELWTHTTTTKYTFFLFFLQLMNLIVGVFYLDFKALEFLVNLGIPT
jgi:hypothetical protein